jgi:hypothetical protein
MTRDELHSLRCTLSTWELDAITDPDPDPRERAKNAAEIQAMRNEVAHWESRFPPAAVLQFPLRR